MNREEANRIMEKRDIDPTDVDAAKAKIADMSGGRRAQARVALGWLLRNPLPPPPKPKPAPKPKAAAKPKAKKKTKSKPRKS